MLFNRNDRIFSWIFVLLLSLLWMGCSTETSGSRPYAPPAETFESQLFAAARTDIFPDDVRQNEKANKERLFLWSGIVRKTRIAGGLILTDYEHHYWDWVEDYGLQREKVFLSPRGEGNFRCQQQLQAFGGAEKAPLPAAGSMAVVYGTLERVEPDKTVVLRCAPITKTIPPEKYSMNIWDYGREFLLHGDKSDFKILNVEAPLRKE